MKFAEKLSPLAIKPEDRLSNSDVVISAFGEAKKKLRFKRGDVVALTVDGKTVYRTVKFGPAIKKGEIKLGYDTILETAIGRTKGHYNDVEVTFEKVGIMGTVMFLWEHPDAGIRVGVRYATYLYLFDTVLNGSFGLASQILG